MQFMIFVDNSDQHPYWEGGFLEDAQPFFGLEGTDRMKSLTKVPFFIPILVAALGSVLAPHVAAQTFKTLHSFTGGFDGGAPLGGLTLFGNKLYGTTSLGGNIFTEGWGTLFGVNPDGTGFTPLRQFYIFASPSAGLIKSGSVLYGTMPWWGTNAGTVFAIAVDGTGFTELHNFTHLNADSDGGNPMGGLILSENFLYGTANVGGASNKGTVFAVTTDGTSLVNLHTFTGSDGANPQASLVLSGKTLYGTTTDGGDSDHGTVFAVNTDSTGFTTLHSFTAIDGPALTNSDGAYPQANLVLSGNTLYGTAKEGGNSGKGTLFAISTDGTGFRNLHSFTGVSDGAKPSAGMILLNSTLFGTASQGGSFGKGTIFAINSDDTGFTILHSFKGGSEGADPQAGLTLSGDRASRPCS
jgi:uncharacterized repeat protein (TIGR03803 family)